MSVPPALEAARLYVEAGAADAFARRLLLAHGVPEHDAATVAACPSSARICAASTPTGSAACRATSTAFGAP
jgi:hypothetical protein